MRVAVVSDIHGNLTALEAVIKDLKQAAPDLILHGGDLADGGARPEEAVDRIRALGWQGVVGNTDELLFDPGALAEFAKQAPSGLQPMFAAIEERAAATREVLGEERLDWLLTLPRMQLLEGLVLVHASPDSLWRAPATGAGNQELESVYGSLGRQIAVYGHLHQSFVRNLAVMTVVNTGSVSLSYDGDCRAAYLLVDESGPTIRRVAYDVQAEVKALRNRPLPHSDWIARMLLTARFEVL